MKHIFNFSLLIQIAINILGLINYLIVPFDSSGFIFLALVFTIPNGISLFFQAYFSSEITYEQKVLGFILGLSGFVWLYFFLLFALGGIT